MPLYEYTCNACEEGFTLLQSVHARPEETVCPARPKSAQYGAAA